MARVAASELRLHHVESGDPTAPPTLLVHGSWSDHASWDGVRPALAQRLRVVAYDRRGYGHSPRGDGPPRLDAHVEDAARLVERLGLAPANVVGSSMGGVVALRLALRRPDLVRALVLHEPPLMALAAPARDDPMQASVRRVMDLLAAGHHEEGTRRFVEEVGYGPGEWDRLPEPVRRGFVRNARNWLDEMREPGVMDADIRALSAFTGPALVTSGTRSPRVFPHVADLVAKALPGGRRAEYEGATHAPQVTHPEAFVETVTRFLRSS